MNTDLTKCADKGKRALFLIAFVSGEVYSLLALPISKLCFMNCFYFPHVRISRSVLPLISRTKITIRENVESCHYHRLYKWVGKCQQSLSFHEF